MLCFISLPIKRLVTLSKLKLEWNEDAALYFIERVNSLLFIVEHVILSSNACGDQNHDLPPTFSSMSCDENPVYMIQHPQAI